MSGPSISLSPAELRRLAGGSSASDADLEAAADAFLAGDDVWDVVTEWARVIVQLAEESPASTVDSHA